MLLLSESSFSPQWIDPGPPIFIKWIYIAMFILLLKSLFKLLKLMFQKLIRKQPLKQPLDTTVSRYFCISIGSIGSLAEIRLILGDVSQKGFGTPTAFVGSIGDAIAPFQWSIGIAFILLAFSHLSIRLTR